MDAGPDTAFLLHGDSAASPFTWRVRRLRAAATEGKAVAAAAASGRKPKSRVIVCFIVVGTERLAHEREEIETRLRKALRRLRAPLGTALCRGPSGVVARVPAVVEAQWSPELVRRGGVARVLEEGIGAALVETAETEET